MSEYKIYRWDVIISGNSNQQIPMIYIKPDLNFLEFIRKNNYTVMCKIDGTSTLYDSKIINGIVAKSNDTPNCRPNFYEKTGFYVVKLTDNWYGYPHPGSLGNVKFIGLTKNNGDKEYSLQHDSNYKHFSPDDDDDDVSKNTLSSKSSSKSKSKSSPLSFYSKNKIIIILIIILILLFVLFWCIFTLIKSKK